MLGFGETLALGGLGKAIDVWSGRQAAEDERSFNQTMFENRYQMTVKDLRKAGLNPALAYMHGAGGAPSAGAAETGSFSSNLASAVQAKRLSAEVDLIRAQTSSALELARKTKYEADITKRQVPKAEIVEELWEGARDAFSTAKEVGRYAAETAKTFPVIPREKPYRQPLQPVTEAQREQMRRRGFYTRPARKR